MVPTRYVEVLTGGCVEVTEAMKQLIIKEPMINAAISFSFSLNDVFDNNFPRKIIR
jgi:hypothetical protein